MSKGMKSLIKMSACVLATGLLSACGGGGGGNNFDGAANARYEGNWGGICEFDADFNEADIYTLTIDGTKATIDFETYPTSDCSGNASDNGQIVYALDFVGTQNPSTGVCAIDDKVNTTIVSAKNNGVSLNNAQLNLITQNAIAAGGFPKYILLCVNPDGDTLYAFDEASGNGESEANRPTQIDINESVSRQ